ncbi:DUF4192 domain-containing protein [Nocardioides sp. MH1]|uniref:DUF4192 domain-containing protein n=1 Tax=Nocardioides sp. MH1 TaxID=3242490 RepID=UPI003520046D
MTSTPMTLTARSADDLIAAAPLVLGFHPVDSVVMMTSDGGHPFQARADLPTDADPADAPRLTAEVLVDAARRNRVHRLALLFYADDERRVRPVWRALQRACRQARLEVVASFRVEPRRYYPLLGARRLREIGVAYDVSAHPFVAEAVMRGIVVEHDRAALAARLAPDPAAQAAVQAVVERERLETTPGPRKGEERLRWLDRLAAAVVDHLVAGTPIGDADLARLLWLLQDAACRDVLSALVRRADARAHQEFWLDVVRRAPDRFAPAPAALLAWSAYQAGHGAVAWMAIDRCREVHEHHPLAELVARCLEDAIPPDAFAGMDEDDPADELGWDDEDDDRWDDEDCEWDEGLPA